MEVQFSQKRVNFMRRWRGFPLQLSLLDGGGDVDVEIAKKIHIAISYSSDPPRKNNKSMPFNDTLLCVLLGYPLSSTNFISQAQGIRILKIVKDLSAPIAGTKFSPLDGLETIIKDVFVATQFTGFALKTRVLKEFIKVWETEEEQEESKSSICGQSTIPFTVSTFGAHYALID